MTSQSSNPVKRTFRLGKALLLFTASDAISILLPNTICGIFLSLARKPFNSSCSTEEILSRAPLVILWLWLNLLSFDISNQMHHEAIAEDRVNKPWRPLPSGIISRETAVTVLFFLWPSILIFSFYTGGLAPTFFLHALFIAYNDLDYAKSWISRHLLNVGGYVGFLLGAIQVALANQHLDLSNEALRWLGTIAIAVASGIQSMDFYDQEGDALRGRRTLPIVIGDAWARKTMIVSTAFVSVGASTLMGLSPISSVPTLIVGTIVCRRYIRSQSRDKRYDRTSFKLWCVWAVSLYLMPACHVWGLRVQRTAFLAF